MILNRQQLRDIDERALHEYSVPSLLLMENAGRSIAEHLISLSPQGEIIVCCGKGNNAGDGFVVARHLDNHNVHCKIVLIGDPQHLSSDAKINYTIALNSQIPILFLNERNIGQILPHILSLSEWVVDALFGIGFKGKIVSPYDEAITIINGTSKKVVSIDIPSGLDCDVGIVSPIIVRAYHTVSLIATKPGFYSAGAKDFVGRIINIEDIGVPKKLIEHYMRQE